jgi:uncharacterized protein (DUF1697 family)
MGTVISMIRGINVGGRRNVRMEDLAALYKSLNFTRVRTYLQSGNVLFDASEKDPEKLAALIEERIQKKFGFEAKVIIRTADEFRRIVSDNPFLRTDDMEPSKLM